MTTSSLAGNNTFKMAGLAITAFVVVFGLAYVVHIADRPVARHVPAEPYEWPVGCKPARASDDTGGPSYVRYYTTMDKIPTACMDPKYYIADPGKFGLKRQVSGIRNYYRIGPDAVNIDCFDDGNCVVDHIERDVFSQSGNPYE